MFFQLERHGALSGVHGVVRSKKRLTPPTLSETRFDDNYDLSVRVRLLCPKQAELLALRVMRGTRFEFFQFGDRNQASIHHEQCERVKCNTKECPEQQHQKTI
jgi:hypothetical protein